MIASRGAVLAFGIGRLAVIGGALINVTEAVRRGGPLLGRRPIGRREGVSAKLVQRMQNMIISVDASSGVDGKFQGICSSVDDANTLGQLLQMGLMYKQYQSKQDNPDMSQLLTQASITPAGDRIVVHMTLTDDQMASLIKHNTFAIKM